MISIVIPLYNKAQSITSTIRCIQAQTYQDFEVVVVEGWSSDGSLEIIRALASEDSRIRVLMQQNRHGVTPARNEGVLAAESDCIAFIDGDDRWEPEYLENIVQLMDDFPEAGIYGMSYGVDVSGKTERIEKPAIDGYRGILPKAWRAVGCPFWTGATAIRKSAFEKVGGFDNGIIYGEDIDLWYRLMLETPAAFDGTKCLSFYRLDAENRACNQAFKPEINIPFHIGKYEKYRSEDPEFRRFFDYQMLCRMWVYAGKKEFRDALKTVLRQIDFSLQKPSMYWRFKFPGLYRKFKRSE